MWHATKEWKYLPLRSLRRRIKGMESSSLLRPRACSSCWGWRTFRVRFASKSLKNPVDVEISNFTLLRISKMVLSFCCHDTERLFIFSLRHFFEKFLLFDVFFCLFVEFFFAPFGFIRPCRYENAVAALIACCVATPLLVPSLLIVFVLFFFFFRFNRRCLWTAFVYLAWCAWV